MPHRSPRVIACILLSIIGSAIAEAQQEGVGPETFRATAQVGTAAAKASAEVTIDLRRYTNPDDRTTMLEALRLGGYPRLLPVLRKMPEVGTVTLNGRKVSVRWARQVANGTGRAISIVTDQPLFFVGGGDVNAKPRAGFELAVIQLQLDDKSTGTGTMAAAARVRPGGETGVQIDDYAETPVTLVAVRKVTH